MTISAFVASYGYLAVFLGTLLEGETILLAAGFAAHRGLLDWRVVIAVAIIGGALGDQLAFLLGRWKGMPLIERFPFLARRAPRVRALLERHHAPFILVNRFLYGLRIAGPIMVGTCTMPFLRYAALDAVGAAIWAVTIVAVGYSFGVATQAVLDDFKRVEQAILIGLLSAGFIVWLWRHWRVTHPRKPSSRKGTRFL